MRVGGASLSPAKRSGPPGKGYLTDLVMTLFSSLSLIIFIFIISTPTLFFYFLYTNIIIKHIIEENIMKKGGG
jgi:hypothetical protein